MNVAEPVNLSNCDREPIHIPGSIQPHGSLLVCSGDMRTIRRFAANFQDVTGLAMPGEDAALNDVLDSETVHTIRNAIGMASEPSRAGLIFGHVLASGRAMDISVHKFLDHVLIEFEPAGDGQYPLRLVRDLTARVNKMESVDQLVAQSARLIAGLLAYDRVMIYRFERDGAGKVISEARRPHLESFLGQYFPASDIPKQARALYVQNTIRTITDARFSRVALLPLAQEQAAQVDLSHAHLRSVSR